MEFIKKHLDDMKRCYCASHMTLNDELCIFLASEDPDVACNMYSGKNFENKQNVWTKPGGCMSIVQIPGTKNEFLAVQEFYLKVSPSQSKIVRATYNDGQWSFTDVVKKEYIHRFGILQKDGVNYLVFATIADEKKEKNDWTHSGSIYAGVLPTSADEPFTYQRIYEGLFRNHGFWQTKENGEDVIYFGSDQGILKLWNDGNWQTQTILEGQIGEIATVDIDGDGQVEIMTIEPFHGNAIHIYKNIDGRYQRVWTYDNEIDFAHTLVGCTLAGKPTFVAGIRRMDAELFVVQYEDGEYKVTIVDQGVGPANVNVVNQEDRDLIIAANHTANEACVYIVNK